MERKTALKPNIRIEPKVKVDKVKFNNFFNKKKKTEEIPETSSAFSKADEMEAGFIKTKPSPFTKSTENTETASPINTQSNESTLNNTQNTSDDTTHEAEPNKENNTTTTKTGLQITLSPSTCITALVTLLVTMSFIFLFGLIIGKGMAPTVAKIKPEKLLPQVQVSKEKTEILPKEDLQFLTNLKTNSVATATDEEKTDGTLSKENKKDSASSKDKNKKADDTQVEKDNQNAEKIIPSTRIYDFNIRTAAFRKDEQADTLRKRLEGAGFRTLLVTEKDAKGNWYFVHVLLRGTELRLQEARESFKRFAIRDSIIKEQTEVK